MAYGRVKLFTIPGSHGDGGWWSEQYRRRRCCAREKEEEGVWGKVEEEHGVSVSVAQRLEKHLHPHHSVPLHQQVLQSECFPGKAAGGSNSPYVM